jgi:hypothetical protein
MTGVSVPSTQVHPFRLLVYLVSVVSSRRFWIRKTLAGSEGPFNGYFFCWVWIHVDRSQEHQ